MNVSMLLKLALLGLTLLAAPLGAQEERPVSLREALAEAALHSPDVGAARARADAAGAGARAAKSYLWPSLGIEAGTVRSNDPVAAFGGRLRQGAFTQADFDPARLNHPDALTDWSGAVGAVWAPLDASASAGRTAAGAEAEAARHGAAWTARAAAFRAEARYLEAVGAEQTAAASSAALSSAQANLGIIERRGEEGLLTDVDVLQAQAAVEAARARSIDAERGVADARERLAVALGWPQGVTPVPTDRDFDAAAGNAGSALEGRADLMASAGAVRAAEARVSQASRARLPRLEGFARLETHSSSMFSGAEEDWTVGFQVRVPLFTGFAVSSGESAARSMRDAARFEHEQRLREAQAQVSRAGRAVEAARQGAQAAEAASQAAAEATRLMRRRFEEGMTTTADLLAAEARAADLSAAAVNARLMISLAAAQLAFLTDTNTTDLSGGMDR
jgi:outer membrane protein TolC